MEAVTVTGDPGPRAGGRVPPAHRSLLSVGVWWKRTQGLAGGWLMSPQRLAPGLPGLLVCQGLCGPQPKVRFPNYMLGPRWGQPGGSCRPGRRLQRQFPGLGPQEAPDPPGSRAAVVLSTYAGLCRVGTSAPSRSPIEPSPTAQAASPLRELRFLKTGRQRAFTVLCSQTDVLDLGSMSCVTSARSLNLSEHLPVRWE